jgi:hypothetical protein
MQYVSYLMQQDFLANKICIRFGSANMPPFPIETVGIALQTLHLLPLNALRHYPENGTCGWYIWGGSELSTDPEFFQPLHFSHLLERLPKLVPYLSLAPGWRVLLAPDYEDVWYDKTLV